MQTKILMSFAMANHGANFSIWLRDALMKHYSLYHVEAIYVDSVVARSRLTRHANHFDSHDIQRLNNEIVANVSPDRRPHMRSATGAFPIGAMRHDWDILYKEAMSSAQAMIFIYTNEFMDSQWCQQELTQFHKENTLRQMNKKPLLRGVFLEFTPINRPFNIFNQAHITKVTALRTNGQYRGLAWDKDDFILSPKDFTALVSALGHFKPRQDYSR